VEPSYYLRPTVIFRLKIYFMSLTYKCLSKITVGRKPATNARPIRDLSATYGPKLTSDGLGRSQVSRT